MKLEVLISTYNRKDISFITNMNLKTDVIIGNQNGENRKIVINKSCGKLTVICSDTIGLACNRNITLENSNADICLLADDDLIYTDNYERIVLDRFKENPDVDVIIFNLVEPIGRRFITKKRFHINHFNYMRFGSVRIAFRRKSIIDNGIKFDERFGSGSRIPMGEDTIFLRDCLKAGLRILAVPDFILTLTEERESTWFKGYTNNYFYNKGMLFKRLYPNVWPILCLQDVIRHYKSYGGKSRIWKIYQMMVKGAFAFSSNV